MKNHKVEGGHLLVLRKGELLVRSLVEFCSQQKITAGWVSGIGAVNQIELGYYDFKNKSYQFQQLNGFYEILGLSGNISLWNKQIVPHLHIHLADTQLQATGGHLKEATVGGTAEIYLQVFDQPLVRADDPTTGLKLIQ